MTWAEVDFKTIEFNLNEIKSLASKNKFLLSNRSKSNVDTIITPNILAVIKAEAYGHGMKEVGRFLENNGVDFFGVSDVQEGIDLRDAGCKGSILLLESALPVYAMEIVDFNLTATVSTFELAKALDCYAKKNNKKVSIHVEIDTGMGRLGIWHEEAYCFIEKLYQFENLNIEGVYTHFPVADSDRNFTEKQIELLNELVSRLDRNGFIIPFIHAANSMGLAGFKTDILNLVRPGLMIYGLLPNKQLENKIKLKPAFEVKSKIIFFKK